jgi:hypothetical protein
VALLTRRLEDRITILISWKTGRKVVRMTSQQREEFWRRFHGEIERFREREANCDVAVNPLEVRLWDVKFTRRRADTRRRQ